MILRRSSASPEDIADEESWSLILVNQSHPIPDDYEIPSLTELANGNAIDSRVYPHLQAMFDDARAQGIYPSITSSYRTTEKQQELMDNKIAEYISAGYDQDAARELAEEWVAIPGTSEHQTGLVCDITDYYRELKDSSLELTDTYQWLKAHCAEYGFVVRYPADKSGSADSITGIIYEPWHFRYVGVEPATYMMQNNLCLEEFLSLYGVE